ncbi:hypothetical protein AQUCO_01600009v1 [Aquilegia coerulea]|uniref:Cytochrome P450 n=2 Tax=Aquilegia coerulea TaxID=218851 RepID=A0A2G5DQ05_AQUCA|nr:hypothetical protein AQUCO_01600009v1 [Aquilegia coerulea]
MEKVVWVVTVSSAVLAIFLTWNVFCWIWLNPKKLDKYLRKKGVKGPSYRFLHGNLKELVSLTKKAQSRPMERSHRIVQRVLPFHDQFAESYGRMFTTWYGPTLKLNIMKPELLKEIFMNKSGHFVKPRSNPLSKLLVSGLVIYEGKKWAKHRRILNPAFHPEKLKMMSPAFYTTCSNLISKWQNLDFSEGSCELDVWPDLQNITKDVISRTAFGSSYEEGRRIFQLIDELGTLVFQDLVSLNIPGFRFLPTKRNNRMKKIGREVRNLLRDIVKKREMAINMGEAPKNDLLGVLMESNHNEMKDDMNSKRVGMTIDEIIDECRLFYFAGQESTSTLLVWTMIVLSMHQDWQEKAREEVMKVFGSSKPDFDGLNQLKIVTMILHEVLRLYPPTPFISRANDKEINLGDVTVPEGVQLALPILLIHHSRELWGEDAEEFKPERFARGVSEATKNQVSYFPFGWGPRICAGQTFVFVEAKMALSMILQQFSFELSSTYIHAPYSILTIKPQYGAQLILHKL